MSFTATEGKLVSRCTCLFAFAGFSFAPTQCRPVGYIAPKIHKICIKRITIAGNT